MSIDSGRLQALGRRFGISTKTTAIGSTSQATGPTSTAIGAVAKATAVNSTALAYLSWATNGNRTAVGTNTRASGDFLLIHPGLITLFRNGARLVRFCGERSFAPKQFRPDARHERISL